MVEALADNQQGLEAALRGAGFYLPEGAFEPFTFVFTIGDPWDQLLDDIQEVLDLTPSLGSYEELIAKVAEGEPLPTNTGSRASATACFDPTLGEAGAAKTFTVNALGWSGEWEVNEFKVQGMGTSPDNPERRRITQSNTWGNEWSRGEHYIHRDITVDAENYTYEINSEKVEQFLGTSPNFELTLNVGSETLFSPGRKQRFDLLAGESYEQTYTIQYSECNRYNDDGLWQCEEPVSSSLNPVHIVTFLGIESVTVPAGTFDACRFRSKSEEGGLGGDYFYTKATGLIEVKVMVGEETGLELVSVTD